MTREEIIAKTNDVFAESFEIEPERLKPEANVFLDLGLDSLDVAELVMNMEDELGVTIEISPALKTIQDVAALVDEQKK